MFFPVLAEITDNTPISIGLVLGVLGFLGGTVWWASQIQTKLDALIKLLSSIHKDTEQLRNKVAAVEHRVSKVEFEVSNLKDLKK